jgi:hypothetical protein
MCEHTSQFTGCRFWIDEDSDEKVVLISETEASAYEYKWWQGFTEYEKSAISNISLIREKVRQAGTEIDIWDRPIPADVKIPEKLPSLPSNSSMVAVTVVREFELKVVDVDGNEVYSATLAALDKRGEKWKDYTINILYSFEYVLCH